MIFQRRCLAGSLVFLFDLVMSSVPVFTLRSMCSSMQRLGSQKALNHLSLSTGTAVAVVPGSNGVGMTLYMVIEMFKNRWSAGLQSISRAWTISASGALVYRVGSTVHVIVVSNRCKQMTVCSWPVARNLERHC